MSGIYHGIAAHSGILCRNIAARGHFLHHALQLLQPFQNRIHALFHLRLCELYESKFDQHAFLVREADLVGKFREHADIPHQCVFIYKCRVFPQLCQIVL